tara:strand:- start:339 stop:617 length:279 start_codon:yes stop_codon:yes gene_type:complete
MKNDRLYKEEDVKELRPYRLQYSMAEAGYMLDIPADSVKEKARHYEIQLYTLGPESNSRKLYIAHNDLVDMLEKMKQFENSWAAEIYKPKPD